MNKANVIRSSSFHMDTGDTLHLIFIDETGTVVDTILIGADEGTDVVPNAPVANAATSITSTGFTANWNMSENSTGYYLDVAEDSAFTSFVAGYENLNMANVITKAVAGLNIGMSYYYRVRAYNEIGTSSNSNTITTTTLAVFDDYFLPSKDESNAMYTELYLHGVGITVGNSYATSSEVDANNYWYQYFSTGAVISAVKGTFVFVRACRAFTSTTVYSLRDAGPTGGLIFWKSGNDYLEAAPSDLSTQNRFSNITNVAIGTTGTAIGTGQANTTAIINQAGHTMSAAKLCDDLIT